MRLVTARDPGIASLPRRATAVTIDMVVIGGAMIGGVVGVAVAVDRRREDDAPSWMDRLQESDVWSRRAITAALWSLELTGRNWRTPGMRATGTRRADAHTGGPVSFRSAGVGLIIQLESERIGRALGQPASARAESRRLAANDEIERMYAARPNDDHAELVHDAVEIRRRHGASSCTWLLPRALVRLAIEQLPALWSSRRQTLTQRLAGTTVVLDR